MKELLLITPPFTQLNTPYPATAYIKGFLNTKSITSFQIDLGIEVILALFSSEGLSQVFAQPLPSHSTSNAQRIYALKHTYIQTIDAVIGFLQNKNPSLARYICSRNFLPEASRFDTDDDLEWAFGQMGLQDKAKHLATLYLEDLSDYLKECVDPHFGFSRYAERLGRSANQFDELYQSLQEPDSYIDGISLGILHQKLTDHQPRLVCFSVPFPGNLYAAFKAAQYIKGHFPTIKIVIGGGFANTELRSLKEPRVFEFFDYICLDDGERPLELVIAHLDNEATALKRTFVLNHHEVVYQNTATLPDYKHSEVGTPDYTDLPLQNYLSVIEVANPMHSLWSDGRWNKLTMAHGCYWGKCTFCDISLDYIKLYEPIAAKILVDRMEELIAQTGENGFHFVDEAAPPALMRELALEILRRKLVVSWWTNIRFEKSFTADLCYLLQASGCIAVSGGLEVASDRLLALIDKGVTVAQVAQVTNHFVSAGIMIHAYLMYGYPTQTEQETVDSLEMVRQLFELGLLHSAYWHQFALTAHSPIGQNPDKYGIIPDYKTIHFADNDIAFTDSTGINHDKFSFGLKKSLYNYMHGICFEYPLQKWFDFKIPKTKIAADYIESCLTNQDLGLIKPTAKIVWLGQAPTVEPLHHKKGPQLKLHFHHKNHSFTIQLDEPKGRWLLDKLAEISFENPKHLSFDVLKNSFEAQFEHFELFWYAKPIDVLRENGLLVF